MTHRWLSRSLAFDGVARGAQFRDRIAIVVTGIAGGHLPGPS